MILRPFSSNWQAVSNGGPIVNAREQHFGRTWNLSRPEHYKAASDALSSSGLNIGVLRQHLHDVEQRCAILKLCS
eukprot:3929634-Amphidinium_carterae.1